MVAHASPRLCMYTLYLPLNYNNGAPIPEAPLRWARDEIARFVGGCTVLPASDGLWVADDGQEYLDRVVPILVVAPNTPETEWFFRQLAHELATLLEQHELFIYRTPVTMVEALSPLVSGLRQAQLLPQPDSPESLAHFPGAGRRPSHRPIPGSVAGLCR